MDIQVEKRTSKINTWKPKEYQKIVERDGKLFICHFSKLFGHAEKVDLYKTFVIGKESYINQLDIITSYINFFVNNYDFDNELITGYLKTKFALDKEHLYDESNMDSYIDFLYEVIFTNTMVEKIVRMVEENYLDDIDQVQNDERRKYIKNDKKHLESLEFTNQHIKILLQISFGMKIMSPCLFHYVQKSHIKIEKDSLIIFNFYKRLFDLFGYANTWNYYRVGTGEEIDHVDADTGEIFYKDEILNSEPLEDSLVIPRIESMGMTIKNSDDRGKKYAFTENGEELYYQRVEINMFNKLYVYVKTKVLESNANNSPIFAQREIFGVDVYTVVKQFTKKVLISENVVKFKFNEHYDKKLKKYKENVLGFMKTIIKFQLSYFLKDQYTKTITEITNTKNSEGLSGSDKMMMNCSKIDEGVITMADLNIKMTIQRIKRIIDIPFTEEEVQYYMVNHRPTELQCQLVRTYYTKYFGSYRDLSLLSRHDYMVLLVLLKKKLLLELGYEDEEEGKIHNASLPYILSGNVSDKINTRIIRNNKFLVKIKESDMYKELIERKYQMLSYIKEDAIISILSQVINTKFTYVTYEYPELLGTEINYSEDKISDELLFFLNSL